MENPPRSLPAKGCAKGSVAPSRVDSKNNYTALRCLTVSIFFFFCSTDKEDRSKLLFRYTIDIFHRINAIAFEIKLKSRNDSLILKKVGQDRDHSQ